jgi:hypothetical protein
VKSSITNCYIAFREGDGTLIDVRADGLATVNLNGYAIIPLEEYETHIGNVAACAGRQNIGD